jgi:hypothetical protein
MKTKRQQELWEDVLQLTRIKNWEKNADIVADVQAKMRDCESLSARKTDGDRRTRSSLNFEIVRPDGTSTIVQTRIEAKALLGTTLSRIDTAVKNHKPLDTGEYIFKRIRQYQLYENGELIAEGTLKQIASKTEYTYDSFMSKIYGELKKYKIVEIEPL